MPCKAIKLTGGVLGEITVPCLMVSERSGGIWAVIKPSVALNQLVPSNTVEVLIEGWYLTNKGKDPEFHIVGSTFDLKGKDNFVLGPWA